MDILDFMERETAETWRRVNAEFDGWQERSFKLVSALVAAGGAASAYALGRAGAGGAFLEWVPVAVLAACWLGIAAHVLLQGMRSVNLPIGPGPMGLGIFYAEQGGKFQATPSQADIRALIETRKGELKGKGDSMKEIRAACKARAVVMNRAYLPIALSPLPGLVCALGLYWRTTAP